MQIVLSPKMQALGANGRTKKKAGSSAGSSVSSRARGAAAVGTGRGASVRDVMKKRTAGRPPTTQIDTDTGRWLFNYNEEVRDLVNAVRGAVFNAIKTGSNLAPFSNGVARATNQALFPNAKTDEEWALLYRLALTRQELAAYLANVLREEDLVASRTTDAGRLAQRNLWQSTVPKIYTAFDTAAKGPVEYLRRLIEKWPSNFQALQNEANTLVPTRDNLPALNLLAQKIQNAVDKLDIRFSDAQPLLETVASRIEMLGQSVTSSADEDQLVLAAETQELDELRAEIEALKASSPGLASRLNAVLQRREELEGKQDELDKKMTELEKTDAEREEAARKNMLIFGGLAAVALIYAFTRK